MIKELLKSFMSQAIESVDRIKPKSDKELMDVQTKTALTEGGNFYFVNFAFVTKDKDKRDKMFKAFDVFFGPSSFDDKVRVIKLREEGK